jgi:hypothetical protein
VVVAPDYVTAAPGDQVRGLEILTIGEGRAKSMDVPRPRGVTIVAALMIIFGLAEIITGFTHNFVGLHTAQGTVSTWIGVSIGVLYAAAGVILVIQWRMAAVAIVLLLMVIAGRILMVVAGLYPVSTLRQVIAMVLGTSIAAGCAIFIALQRSVLR